LDKFEDRADRVSAAAEGNVGLDSPRITVKDFDLFYEALGS